MDLVGQNDTCHLLEDDEKGCHENEQEQMEAMLVGKGTRTATPSTVNCINTLNTYPKVLSKYLHVCYAFVARHGSSVTPSRAAAPSSAKQPGQQLTLKLDQTQATCHPASVRPRALVLPQVPDEQDHGPVKAVVPRRL